MSACLAAFAFRFLGVLASSPPGEEFGSMRLRAAAVGLPPGPPTAYHLRAEPKEGGLSTLEAIARAFCLLEGPQAGPVVAGLQRAVAETRRRLESPNAAALTCVGRLGRDIDGAVAFVPSPSSSVPPGGELLVIGPGGSVATVGKCGPDGRATIAARGSLVAGVPVFAWQQKGTK